MRPSSVRMSTYLPLPKGLATGVRASIHRPPLAKVLELNAEQTIIMAQCVGYLKK